jgi:pSer/pThr/pTyr-binding forkhead associated (FHA) protein
MDWDRTYVHGGALGMARITLRVIDGADRGRAWEEIPTPVTIGREEGNTIQLSDERISRFHLKIQEDQSRLVLTDLDSTNGTRVNGEDVQLRTLRHGDVIALGRSVLLVGTREQIAERLRQVDPEQRELVRTATRDSSSGLLGGDDWWEDPTIAALLHTPDPPELPSGLSPGQGAQLSELIQFLHATIRELIRSMQVDPHQRVTLGPTAWQKLLDFQDRLGCLLRQIGEP